MIKKNNMKSKKCLSNNATKKTTNVTHGQICDLIRVRAYEIYCERSENEGDDFLDWLTAEKQIKSRLGLQS